VLTPPTPIDVTVLVPGIDAYARTATRLHPRRASVTADVSHVGGPIRWPADDPWPICTTDCPGPDEVVVPQLYGGFLAVPKPPGRGARELPHPGPNPMLVLAQLRAPDVPDLWCPPGTDLLQILWCPFDHDQPHASAPTVALRWRRQEASIDVLAAAPVSAPGNDGYRPTPCALYPEQVVEYPDRDDLPADLVAAIDDSIGDSEAYQFDLSIAPGWKVGGWPNWALTDKQPTECDTCDQPTILLLTIDSSEGDGRWQPIEERGLGRDEARSEPTGIEVGRWGSLQIFVCTTCPDYPVRLDIQ